MTNGQGGAGVVSGAQPGLRVAYLVNQYPKVSHTFIRREILALEARGVTVRRFAIRGWDAEVVDPVDRSEREKTRYLLQAGVVPLLMAFLRVMLADPRKVFAAFRAALAMSRRSVRSWPYHLIWLAQACQLRLWLQEAGGEVSHIHAHFGTNPVDVVCLLRMIGGPEYSFTVHGPDEFDNAHSLSLPRKAAGARFVVLISDYTRAQFMRAVPPDCWDKLKVVHCGLDEGFFATEPVPFPENPVLLCIGRLNEQKGHVTLLDALARLGRRDVKVVLAGDGELRDMIEARIRALGLEGQVRITGWISSDEVRRLLTESTVLVQPSFMEGLPVVLMEALAQGRPVISTYVAGIPELVQQGKNGWLVPTGDAESLATAIGAALDTPVDVLAEMGRAGMVRVRARHHIDTEAGKLAALFSGRDAV